MAKCTFTAKEMRRRLDVVRNVMEQSKVSALIILDGYWEGYTQWLIGTRNVKYLVVFPTGASFAVPFGNDALFSPFSSVSVAEGVDCIIVSSINSVPFDKYCSKKSRIGFIHLEAMSVSLKKELIQLCGQTDYVDITSILDPYKATKSPEELKEIESTVKLHEQVLRDVPSVLTKGKEIYRVDQDLRYLCQNLGSDNAECLSLVLQCGNSRKGALTIRGGFQQMPDKIVETGDMILVLLEVNSASGHFSALGRYFSIGEPSKEDLYYWNIAVQVQDFAASRLKPNAKLLDIYEENREYIETLGVHNLPRNYLHSLGYCFGEKPFLFDKTETVPLRENMVYIVHPYISFQRKNLLGEMEWDEMCCIDTFRITPEGGIRQNSIPREIIVV